MFYHVHSNRLIVLFAVTIRSILGTQLRLKFHFNKIGSSFLVCGRNARETLVKEAKRFPRRRCAGAEEDSEA